MQDTRTTLHVPLLAGGILLTIDDAVAQFGLTRAKMATRLLSLGFSADVTAWFDDGYLYLALPDTCLVRYKEEGFGTTTAMVVQALQNGLQALTLEMV